MNKPGLFFSFLFLGLIVALAISTVCAANPDNITINDNSVTLDQYMEIVPIEETEKMEIKEKNIKEVEEKEEITKEKNKEYYCGAAPAREHYYKDCLDGLHETEKSNIDYYISLLKYIVSPFKGCINEPDDIESQLKNETPFMRGYYKYVGRPMIGITNYFFKFNIINSILGNPAGVDRALGSLACTEICGDGVLSEAAGENIFVELVKHPVPQNSYMSKERIHKHPVPQNSYMSKEGIHKIHKLPVSQNSYMSKEFIHAEEPKIYVNTRTGPTPASDSDKSIIKLSIINSNNNPIEEKSIKISEIISQGVNPPNNIHESDEFDIIFKESDKILKNLGEKANDPKYSYLKLLSKYDDKIPKEIVLVESKTNFVEVPKLSRSGSADNILLGDSIKREHIIFDRLISPDEEMTGEDMHISLKDFMKLAGLTEEGLIDLEELFPTH